LTACHSTLSFMQMLTVLPQTELDIPKLRVSEYGG
jgi:hypothetical protein